MKQRTREASGRPPGRGWQPLQLTHPLGCWLSRRSLAAGMLGGAAPPLNRSIKAETASVGFRSWPPPSSRGGWLRAATPAGPAGRPRGRGQPRRARPPSLGGGAVLSPGGIQRRVHGTFLTSGAGAGGVRPILGRLGQRRQQRGVDFGVISGRSGALESQPTCKASPTTAHFITQCGPPSARYPPTHEPPPPPPPQTAQPPAVNSCCRGSGRGKLSLSLPGRRPPQGESWDEPSPWWG